jgi:hypothetical protein
MAGRLTPISRREFIRRMLRLGFDGPFSGGRHEFVVRGDRRLILPNPHRSVIRRASTFNTSRIDHIYVDPHKPGA